MPAGSTLGGAAQFVTPHALTTAPECAGKGVPVRVEPACPRAYTYWGKTLQVRQVRQVLFLCRLPFAARSRAHWHKAIQVRPVRQGVHAGWESHHSHARPHGECWPPEHPLGNLAPSLRSACRLQGEKPCICKVCNTAYKTSGGLAAHRKAHAATCGAAYATGPGSLADQTAKQAKMTDKESR